MMSQQQNISRVTRSFSVILLVLIVFLSGCVTHSPYDYSNLIAAKPRSILVIPPMNNSVEVDAPYTYLSTISKPLAEKGYYVFPVAVIDNFLKENGLPSPAEMHSIPLDKIREFIGADAVLYVTIQDWGQKYQVLSSKTVVEADLRLVDARSGVLLWQAKARGERGSNNNNNGLAAALVGAIIDQVAGSIVDHTPEVSRFANNTAINSQSRGLLNGPYKPVVEAK